MRRYVCLVLWVVLAVSGRGQSSSDQPIRTDRRMAADGVTEAWLLSYDNPDPDRSWERIAGTLVIARHGKVLRSIVVASTIRSWAFWRGGTEVAVEAGGLHGPSGCSLVSVASGRTVATVKASCDTGDAAAPAWVRVLAGNHAEQSSTPAR